MPCGLQCDMWALDIPSSSMHFAWHLQAGLVSWSWCCRDCLIDLCSLGSCCVVIAHCPVSSTHWTWHLQIVLLSSRMSHMCTYVCCGRPDVPMHRWSLPSAHVLQRTLAANLLSAVTNSNASAADRAWAQCPEATAVQQYQLTVAFYCLPVCPAALLGGATAATVKMAEKRPEVIYPLMAPYLAWVTFATALNAEILRLNPDVSGANGCFGRFICLVLCHIPGRVGNMVPVGWAFPALN